MTVLSSQSIRDLCVSPNLAIIGRKPMIIPFQEAHSESGLTGGLSSCGYDLHIKDSVVLWPGDFILGVTVERLCLPNDIVGIMYDKSSLKRLGFTVGCATVAEPGWEGYLTLELHNCSKHKIIINEGQPIGQMMFHRLDQPTEDPYNGRYQNQGAEPQPTMFLDAKE